jgi:purine-binding chemotaxis protein CheW
VGLVVDAAVGVQEYAEQEMIGAAEVLPAAKYLDGVAKLADGLLLVHDLDTFLSLEEDEALDGAMS